MALLAGLVVAAGCGTLLFDPDDLIGSNDAGTGGGPADGGSSSGDFVITPAPLHEGMGGPGVNPGRPQPVVLDFTGIGVNLEEAEIVLVWPGEEVTNCTVCGGEPNACMQPCSIAQWAEDGQAVALNVRVPVFTEGAQDPPGQVVAAVASGGQAYSAEVVLEFHDELVFEAGIDSRPSEILNAGSPYSTISVETDTQVVGSEPLRLHAYGDVMLGGNLVIDGSNDGPRPGSGAGGTYPAVGSSVDDADGQVHPQGPGCQPKTVGDGREPLPGGRGGCGGSLSGGGGLQGGNGGGGANATAGAPGTPSSESGEGGEALELAALLVSPLLGGAGGGAGAPTTDGPGGYGGAGGGAVSLSSSSFMWAAGFVSAAGLNGAEGMGDPEPGSGGGGSGGSVALGAPVMDGAANVNLGGGAGVNGAGNGGSGWIRVNGAVDVMFQGGQGVQTDGISLPGAPLWTAEEIALSVSVPANTPYQVGRRGAEVPAEVSLTDSPITTVVNTDEITRPEAVEVCAILGDEAPVGRELRQCVWVAFFP